MPKFKANDIDQLMPYQKLDWLLTNNLKNTAEKSKEHHFVEMDLVIIPDKACEGKNLNIELTKKNGEKMSISGELSGESLNLILRSFLEAGHMKVIVWFS